MVEAPVDSVSIAEDLGVGVRRMKGLPREEGTSELACPTRQSKDPSERSLRRDLCLRFSATVWPAYQAFRRV